MMKKLLLFLFGATLLLNLSCSRDDDSSDFSGSVVGSWYLYSIGLNGTVTKNGISSPINTTQVLNSCMQKSTVILNQDGTGNATSWEDTSGTCTQVQDDKLTYTYDASTKVLNVKTGTKIDVTSLIKLSNTEMVGEENVTNFAVEGATFTGKITTTMKRK